MPTLSELETENAELKLQLTAASGERERERATGTWRLLDVGEVIQEGDEYFSMYHKLWDKCQSIIGEPVQILDDMLFSVVRRRMSAATTALRERLDELEAAAKEFEWFYDDELDGWYCMWCGNGKGVGHSPKCIVFPSAVTAHAPAGAGETKGE